jgi:putative redox protein
MTKQVNVTWVQRRQFVGTDTSKHSVVMSSQDKENATGMKPSDLLLVSLGGCTAYDVVDILHKKRQKLTGLEVTVSAEQEADPPWTYRTIHLHYKLRGKGLKDKAVHDAIELSEQKYCSVSATLRGEAEITYDYTIVEDE